jgi:uncharacterized membrane protein
MEIKTRHILYAIDIITILLVLIIAFFPGSVLRIVLGLPLVLFFPGYVLMSALFPRRSALDRIEKVALSFGMSIAVVPLIGLVLNYTPWGIRLYPILISLAVFIVALSAIGWYRQLHLPEAEKPSLKVEFKKITLAAQSRSDKVLTAVLVVAIIGAIGTLAYVVAMPRSGEKFTEFYILGQNGKAEDYPTQLSLGESGNVIVGIINHEQATTNYAVGVTIDGVSTGTIGPIVLVNEEKSERTVSFKPQKTGDKQEVEFLLYQNGQEQNSESLHLWVDVK